MPDSRLPKKCLLRLVQTQIHDQEKFNWILRFNTLLKPINEDGMLDNLSLPIWLSRRDTILRKYRDYKKNLDNNRYNQSNMLQFILANHLTPARLLLINLHHLICIQCHLFSEETAAHILVEFPAYKHLRRQHLQQWMPTDDPSSILDSESLASTKARFSYLCAAVSLRNNNTSPLNI
ncbi:hypothetical protein KQX54_013676 [Cotesia glomerata]|uniref:Reverse transcriptase zinc-binding domain-containing protein n=1 Tax=Cotesia glomerata TaxID=32391 RepID=A0AAV7J683_COTGL|nr:hypothetical protein KQX54_013676 [Cotesia glomerata]